MDNNFSERNLRNGIIGAGERKRNTKKKKIPEREKEEVRGWKEMKKVDKTSWNKSTKRDREEQNRSISES